MAFQDYFYSKAGGDFRWHIQQKCRLAIGREPFAMMDVGEQTVLRFDPPLDPVTEEPLVADIFTDPATAGNMSTQDASMTYMIKDIFDSDFRAVLGADLGCEVTLWFPKSSPELERPDRIAITFNKTLSVQDKKKAETAFLNLVLGWV